MKKILLALIAVLLIVSCSSTKVDDSVWFQGVGMFPAKDIALTSMDLESDLYDVLGPVSGTSSVNIHNADELRGHTYGALTDEEVASMLDNVNLVSTDPFALALSSSINEMNKKATEMGASFVIFPNYFVEFNEGVLTITTNATAVKVTEGTH